MGNELGGISDRDVRDSLMYVSEVADNSGDILATAGVLSSIIPGAGEVAMPILEGAALGSEAVGFGAKWLAEQFFDVPQKPVVKKPPTRLEQKEYATSGNSEIRPFEINSTPISRPNPFEVYE